MFVCMYVFVFNVPPTAEVIQRWGHGFKSHPTDWRSWESYDMMSNNEDFHVTYFMAITLFETLGSSGACNNKKSVNIPYTYPIGLYKQFFSA